MKKILLLTIFVLSLFIISGCHDDDRGRGHDWGRHDDQHEEHH